MAGAGEGPTAVLVEVPVAPADVDVVSGALWAAGAAAIEEVPGPGATVVLRTTPERPEDLEALVAAAGGRPGVRTCEVPLDEGLDAWRAHARPWRAGERLVVWPAWQDRGGPGAEVVRPGDVVLPVDPGRAFGSGAHPSTRLALAEVERLVAPGDRVLDAGCGSGVLGVAAAVLGAGSVVAVDVDPAAVDATTANADLAGVADRVRVVHGSVEAATGTFDLVVANLLAPTLREVGPALAERVAPHGAVVLAGLLDPQVQGVAAAVRTLGVVRRTGADGWAGLVLRPLAR